jgi:hypothetical protein
MSAKLETFTPKDIIQDLLPAKYGKLDGEIKLIFQDHVIDGSVVGITLGNELLATCRIRFTNGIIMTQDYEQMLLQCALTNLVYIKKPTVEDVTDNVVQEMDKLELDNVSLPSSQSSQSSVEVKLAAQEKPPNATKPQAHVNHKQTAGRGRGNNRK